MYSRYTTLHCRVLHYSLDTGYYEVTDADESKKYLLPENQVVVLNMAASQKKLSKGETILAGKEEEGKGRGGGGRRGGGWGLVCTRERCCPSKEPYYGSTVLSWCTVY